MIITMKKIQVIILNQSTFNGLKRNEIGDRFVIKSDKHPNYRLIYTYN